MATSDSQALYEAFREWILHRRVDGLTIEAHDESTLALSTDRAKATVSVYEVDPEAPLVVEFLINRLLYTGDPVFHLHFELTDLDRAEELFNEMLEVLMEDGTRGVRTVLLCCSTGLTTTMFAQKLNEAASSLAMDVTFKAATPDEAMADKGDYLAIMLAPQIGYKRDEVARAYPSIPVFEIPAKIYGAYDAGAAIHLLLDALDATTPAGKGLSLRRRFDEQRRVLVVYVNLHTTRTTIRWRLYEHGKVSRQGRVAKRRLAFQDVEDCLAGLRTQGLDFHQVDAVGVVVPGITCDLLATFPPSSPVTYDFGRLFVRELGVPVFLENDANAAAVGCYATDDRYESLGLIVQRAGHAAGGAGFIQDGRLVKGRQGFAGEIGYAQGLYLKPKAAEAARWIPQWALALTADHVVAASAFLAPEVFHIAVDLVPDMEALRAEVAKHLPEGYVPELVAVDDVRERIFTGMLALCLERLGKEPL